MPEWNPVTAAAEAKKNAIIIEFGVPKSGKTKLGTDTKLDLYIAHLDPNDNLNEHLLARHEKYPDAYTEQPLWIPPTPYRMLTREIAQQYVEKVEAYAAAARARAANTGRPGLFFLDGGKRLKGYVEKWKLGESSTLGFRAQAGNTGPIQIQYAESNAYFNDIINAFVGSSLHVVVSFEAREVWVPTVDDRGRTTRKPSGKYEPKMSSGKENEISYTVNALIETLVEAEKGAVVDNRQMWNYVHKIRFEYLGFVGMSHLRNRTMPSPSFDELLDLLHSNIPAETVLDTPHEIVRMDMSGVESGEEE